MSALKNCIGPRAVSVLVHIHSTRFRPLCTLVDRRRDALITALLRRKNEFIQYYAQLYVGYAITSCIMSGNETDGQTEVSLIHPLGLLLLLIIAAIVQILFSYDGSFGGELALWEIVTRNRDMLFMHC